MPPSWISGGASFGRRCVLAAPLAEISDSAFRALALESGADGAVTEMTCAAALVRGSRESAALLSRLPSERGWCAAQLYGHEPEELEKAARTVAASGAFDAIDLNAGCPMKRIVANGDGAALMEDEARFVRCVEAVVRGAAPLPATVKTRIGLDPSRPAAARLARASEAAGAAAIVMHGRFASRMHAGPVEAGLLAEAVAAVSIPVVANGGVKSAADAVALADATGAAGVAVGRGAVGNPWIFAQIRAAFAGKEIPPGREEASPAALLAAFRRHMALLREARAAEAAVAPDGRAFDVEKAVALDARRHLLGYFRGLPRASTLRRAANEARSGAEIEALAESLYGSLPSETPSSASVGIVSDILRSL